MVGNAWNTENGTAAGKDYEGRILKKCARSQQSGLINIFTER